MLNSERRIRRLEESRHHPHAPSARETQSIFEILTWLGEPVSTPAEAWQLYCARKGAKP
jgi:hypothetical protein